MNISIQYLTKVRHRMRLALIAFMTFSMIACGGGDGSGTPPPSNIVTISTPLSGLEVVPAPDSGNPGPVNSTGEGTAVITLNTDTGEISGSVDVKNLGSVPGKAHIHVGQVGTHPFPNIIVILDRDSFDATTNSATFSIPTDQEPLSAENIAKITSGETYFQVHSADIGPGELRGQILPDDVNIKRFITLLGGQEIIAQDGNNTPDPQTTPGLAKAVLLVKTDTGELFGGIRIQDTLADPSQAHIHDGVAGIFGPVLVPYTINGTDAYLFKVNVDNSSPKILAPADVTKLLNDGLYFQVHTEAVNSGEIRGQIKSSPIEPTLASIQKNIFSTSCGVGGCHDSDFQQNKLVLDSEANTLANLVGVSAFDSDFDPLLRVEASDPDNSVIVKKLENDPDFKARMPFGRAPLSYYEISIIRQWIADGANP